MVFFKKGDSLEKGMKKTFSVKIAGPAGYGIMGAGRILGEALSSLGFSVVVYPEYPSQIRGGDNVSLVTFSLKKKLVPSLKTDILVAFSRESLLLHYNEVVKDGLLLVDEVVAIEKVVAIRKGGAIKIPLTQIAQRTIGDSLARNTVALGLIFGILGLPAKVLAEEIKETFLKKGKKVYLDNQAAARQGYQLAIKAGLKKKNLGANFFKTQKNSNSFLFSGNDAISQGIIDAQCGYAAIYPMTPINSILTTLAASQKKTGMIVFRPEDEIAGINSAIGASFAGRRAMVATSGGGFCLMAEGFGMAGATETPLVVVEGMRTGPSTGMATWTSQEDLLFLVNVGNGEFPRIIFAPGDPEEAYQLTFRAFNLADIYQLPVIVLTDKYLSESAFSGANLGFRSLGLKIERGKNMGDGEEKDYKRYEDTADGISPRAIPGQTVFLTNSYVHNEKGFSIEDGRTRVKMKQKLFEKLENFKEPGTKLYGSLKSDVTFISFGSTKHIVLAAMEGLRRRGIKANFLHFFRPWPFPKEAKKVLQEAEKIISVENNSTGQLARLIKMETGIEINQQILKDDGRPFFEGEIEGKLKVQS